MNYMGKDATSFFNHSVLEITHPSIMATASAISSSQTILTGAHVLKTWETQSTPSAPSSLNRNSSAKTSYNGSGRSLTPYCEIGASTRPMSLNDMLTVSCMVRNSRNMIISRKGEQSRSCSMVGVVSDVP